MIFALLFLGLANAGYHAVSMELSPENERFIDTAVQRGEYTDRAAAVNDAVRLMRRRQRQLAALRAEIRAGMESGASIRADAVFEGLHRKASQIVKRLRRY